MLLSALTLGLTFAHVLELPQRLGYGADLWMSLTRPNALYRFFGVIGGPLEIAAVVAVCALAVAVRRRVFTRRLMLGAAALHVAALACWIGVVAPANVEIGRWMANGIPPAWERWRVQWESGHAAGFVLLLFGFCLLVVAVLTESHARAGDENRVSVASWRRNE